MELIDKGIYEDRIRALELLVSKLKKELVETKCWLSFEYGTHPKGEEARQKEIEDEVEEMCK